MGSLYGLEQNGDIISTEVPASNTAFLNPMGDVANIFQTYLALRGKQFSLHPISDCSNQAFAKPAIKSLFFSPLHSIPCIVLFQSHLSLLIVMPKHLSCSQMYVLSLQAFIVGLLGFLGFIARPVILTIFHRLCWTVLLRWSWQVNIDHHPLGPIPPQHHSLWRLLQHHVVSIVGGKAQLSICTQINKLLLQQNLNRVLLHLKNKWVYLITETQTYQQCGNTPQE